MVPSAYQPDVPSLLERAISLQQQGEAGQAEALYQAILQAEPEHATAIQLQGLIHNQRGEFTLGELCFRKALQLKPRSVLAHLNLGISLWNLSQLDEACTAFQRALMLEPDNPEALLNRSLVLLGLGRYPEALLGIDRLLTLQPANPDLLVHRGTLLMNLQKPAEALACFNQALDLDPEHLDAVNCRGFARLELKQPFEALADVQQVLAVRPDDVGALMAHGSILLELRQTEEALEVFDHVLQLRPSWAGALMSRHIALTMLHRTAEAHPVLEEILDLHRGNPSDSSTNLILNLVPTLMELGRYSEALELLKEPLNTMSVIFRAKEEYARNWYLLLLTWLQSFLESPLRRLSPLEGNGFSYTLPMVVWGDAYLDTMEQFTLPSLLAEGNLPFLGSLGPTRLIFFTTEAGARRIQNMPIYQELGRTVTIDMVSFPEELTHTGDVYRLMSTMHLASMEMAKASQSHFLFLAPDLIFSDNFLSKLVQRQQEGFDVVFVPGLILHLEAFAEELGRPVSSEDRRLSLAPVELMTLGLRHVHPFVKEVYTYTPNARRSTVAVFLWPTAQGGYVMHGYHHTPFLISAEAMSRFDGSMFNNLDGNFLPKIIRSTEELSRCSCLMNPSETTYFELSRASRFVSNAGNSTAFNMGEFTIERLSAFGAQLGLVATWLFPQKVCFELAEAPDGDPARRESSEVVEQIMQGIRRINHWD